MPRYPQYFSVSKAQWHHIGFNTVYEMRAQQANENNATARDTETVSTEYKAVRVQEAVLVED